MQSEETNYTLIAKKIVKEQEQIIGPLAYDIAKKAVGVLLVAGNQLTIQGDPKVALENLVVQYSGLFGQASVEASKNALKGMSLGAAELPSILL